MMTLTRRSFIAGLAALPFMVKGFVMPSQATVAEFQALELRTALIGDVFTMSLRNNSTSPVFIKNVSVRSVPVTLRRG